MTVGPAVGATPNPDAAPVVGQVLDVQAVEPNASQRAQDARGRIGNTAVQVGVPTAIVTIGGWIALLMRLDLDPGAGTDLPTNVAASFIAVLTAAMAWLMNRRNL